MGLRSRRGGGPAPGFGGAEAEHAGARNRSRERNESGPEQMAPARKGIRLTEL